jgi:phosphoribosyl 1,2-cyclic phosphodiesterase
MGKSLDMQAIGHISDEVKNNLCGCDFVFIESNHDRNMLLNGPYPYFLKKRVANDNGHLSNEMCSEF